GPEIWKTSTRRSTPPSRANANRISPIPAHYSWIDNYVSDVGFYHPEGINVCLDRDNGPITAHSYAWKWYLETVKRPAVSIMGFTNSYEQVLLKQRSEDQFPPKEDYLQPDH